MTNSVDQDAFVRGFLKKLSAKAPLHEWRVALTTLTTPREIVVYGGNRWFRLPVPFELPSVRSICREIQETIDAARALHGD